MKEASGLVRAGHWVFRNRGWLPAPLVGFALLQTEPLGVYTGIGIGLMLLGESIRLWGVSHIGLPARARDAEVQKLIYTGPYELTRNPLYIGNILIFMGLGLATGGPVLALGFLVFFSLYFNLIVRFEEEFLEYRLGEIYRSYRNRVPRWLGESAPVHAASPRGSIDDRARMTLRTERTTIAILAVVTILIAYFASTTG